MQRATGPQTGAALPGELRAPMRWRAQEPKAHTRLIETSWRLLLAGPTANIRRGVLRKFVVALTLCVLCVLHEFLANAGEQRPRLQSGRTDAHLARAQGQRRRRFARRGLRAAALRDSKCRVRRAGASGGVDRRQRSDRRL